MSDDDPADRVEAVLADARDAVEDATDDGDVAATPTLRAVSDAAAGLVEEADSAALLAAVGLDDEDYDSVPEAIARGEPDRVRELEQLLKLSRLADAWDDSGGDQLRSDLPELFDVATGESTAGERESAPGDEGETPDTPDGDGGEGEAQESEGDETEGDETEESDREDDEEGVVESVVERVTDDEDESAGDEEDEGLVVRAVESIAEDEAADDESEDDRGTVASAVESVAEAAADSEESEGGEGSDEEDEGEEGENDEGGVVESVVERVTDEDEGLVESTLRSQLEDAVGQFREGIDRAQADLDALRAVSDDEEDTESEAGDDRTSDRNRGGTTRHSTIPDSDSGRTRHSTIPDGDAGATRHSTIPDSETSNR